MSMFHKQEMTFFQVISLLVLIDFNSQFIYSIKQDLLFSF
jgi:hypothetical protein